MISGEKLLGICVTEPGAGSDAGNMKLRCERDGDNYILNGEKTSITFADCADGFIVFARTGSLESGAAGITAMIVPADSPGLSRTRFNDVGSRIIGRGSVFFDNVRVLQSGRVGEENDGFTGKPMRARQCSSNSFYSGSTGYQGQRGSGLSSTEP